MTEDEAREKWCPMSRALIFDEGNFGYAAASFNRPFGEVDDATKTCHCIASDCACWMWDMEFPEAEEGTMHVHKEQSGTNGHCGLIR